MMDDFTINVDGNLQMLVKNARLFKEMADAHGDCDEHGEMKKFLEESVKKRLQMGEKWIKMEQEHKDKCKAMDQAKGESSTTKVLSQKVDVLKQVAAKKSYNVKNNAKYKCFKKEFESAAGLAGEGPEVAQTGGDFFSLHDPWAMALIKEPMRNKMCGHIYDRGSVNAMIKDNVSVRCPVSGCANKHFIQPSHLVEDHEALEKLHRHMSEQKYEQDSDSN